MAGWLNELGCDGSEEEGLGALESSALANAQLLRCWWQTTK
jgi:hypothetical protein